MNFNSFVNIYTILPFFSGILSLFLGTFVYFKNRKSFVNFTFFLLSFVTFWWQFSWFILFSTADEKIASYLVKIGYVGIIFIPVFFFHFFVSFLREVITKFDKYLLYFSYFASAIFEFFLIITNLFINGFYKYFWGFYPKAGILHPFHLLLLTILATRALYVLTSTLKRKLFTGYKNFQIKYFLFGLIIYIFAASDYVVNYGIEFYPLGPIFVLGFLGILSLAITRYYLFEIRVILTELLVGAIAILLLINIIGSKTTFEYAWKGTLFFTFLFFGWLLIKSIIKEINQREKLDKLATQLAASNIRLESAYKKLQKLDEAKTEFISIASHQLRTPLTAIKGYISMILEGSYGKIPEKVKRPMENVFKSNERLIKLVNELLNVSRIESGRVKLSKEEASLEEIISNIVEELKVEAENKGLYLKFAPLDNKHLTGQEKPLPKILIDKDKIRQVILNIVDNAIKYTENGGVTIKLKMQDEKYRIEISDTGAGMIKEEIGGLFQSFKRGIAGNKLWTEGTGLGLYVAKKFVEMHQGKIWAESEGKGKGSSFFIELPVS